MINFREAFKAKITISFGSDPKGELTKRQKEFRIVATTLEKATTKAIQHIHALYRQHAYYSASFLLTGRGEEIEINTVWNKKDGIDQPDIYL